MIFIIKCCGNDFYHKNAVEMMFIIKKALEMIFIVKMNWKWFYYKNTLEIILL